MGTGLVHGGGMHQKPWYNHGQRHEFPGPPAFGQPGIERLELQGGKLPVAAHHLLYRRSPWCIRIQFPNGIHVLRHLEFSLLRCSYFCQRGSRFSTSAGQLRISVLLDRSSCNANFRIPGVPGVLARMTRSHSLAAASAGKTFTKPSIIQFWIIIGKKFMSPSDSFCAVWGDTSPTRPFSSSEVLSHASKSFMASLWKKSSWAWHVMARSFSMDSGLSTYPKLYGVTTQTLADLRHHNARKKSWQQQRGIRKSIDGRSSGATSR